MKTIKECKAAIATMQAGLDAQDARITELESTIIKLMTAAAESPAKERMPKAKGQRDYGPASENKLNDYMAWRMVYGDLKEETVRNLADDYGYSRAQVYSLRGGYTFKHVTATSFQAGITSITHQQ